MYTTSQMVKNPRFYIQLTILIVITGIYPVDHSHDSCEATIVTAYFRMTSKHSHDEYLAWMRNMLSLRDCLVVFTQSDLVDTIKSLRPVYYPTRILSTNITQVGTIFSLGLKTIDVTSKHSFYLFKLDI